MTLITMFFKEYTNLVRDLPADQEFNNITRKYYKKRRTVGIAK